MPTTTIGRKSLPKENLGQSGQSIADKTTPSPLPLALKRLQVLIKEGKYPATASIKHHKAPKIKQVPWIDPSALTKQRSSSPNLTRKVQDWRDWTDGSLKKHE
jgi:hypothetical protein